jgi:hypothetical protein
MATVEELERELRLQPDTLDVVATIRVGVCTLSDLLDEVKHLRAQRDELQARMKEMVLERQRWRDPARIEEFVERNTVDTSDGFTNRQNLRIDMFEYLGLDDAGLPR